MKRTKTFSGCWTCRSRKVKCDEGKPRCGQCLHKSIECEGYNVRLQWLTPETAHGISVEPASSTTTTTTTKTTQNSHRRQFSIGPSLSPIPYKELDDALKVIDLWGSRPGQDPNLGESFALQNFGVFQATGLSSTTSPTNLEVDRQLHESHDFESMPSPLFSIISGVEDTVDRQRPIHTPSDEGPRDIVLTQPAYDDALDLHEPPSVPSYEPRPGPVRHETDDPDERPTTGRVNRTSTETESPAPEGNPSQREQYLLHHYLHNVIGLFCVIDTPKSPWRNVHVPRLLQGIGQAAVLGATTKVLSALRYCVLSVSAYYLSNLEVSVGNELDASQWAHEATDYRAKAMGFLHQAMANELQACPKVRYKEFLATMLSMITIDVISGDTSSASVHLAGAGQLMRHVRKTKTQFSSKAQALHRIYVYLRLMYESTSSDNPHDTTSFSPGVNIGIQDWTDDNADFDEWVLSTTLQSSDASYERIYGIVEGLIVLMQRTIKFVRHIIHARQESGDRRLSPDLEQQCDKLEQEVMDWPLEDSLQNLRSQFQPDDFRIICYQSRAFHNALIIYFSQQVPLINHRYLRSNIEAVLESMEQIELLKSVTQSVAAPLYWPVFIAASEAFDGNLQSRFRQWYERNEKYQIGAAKTGNVVIFETWESGPTRSEHTTCVWRSVVERTGTTLLLT